MGEVVAFPQEPPGLIAIAHIGNAAAHVINDLLDLRVLLAGLKPGEPVPPIGQELHARLVRNAEELKRIAIRVIDEKIEDFPRVWDRDLH